MIKQCAACLALILFVCVIQPACSAENKLDGFSKCLTQKKAVMYGASTCSHCADQKELFGSSFQYVTYVECMVPETHKETDQCKALDIKHTPTWIFGGGTRHEGVLQLDELSKQTGCKLP